MKRSIFIMLIIALAAALVAPVSVKAQTVPTNSGQATWTSSIYYYNPTDNAGELVVTYFNNDGTVTSTDDDGTKISVVGHQSGEVYIGEVSMTGSFKGSAVLSSSVQIVAIYEQAPNVSPNFSRLLYSAFDVEQARSTIYIPSFMRDPKGYVTQVGVQNTSASAVNFTVKAYDSATGKQVGLDLVKENVANQNSFIFQPTDIPNLPASFKDGSAVITVAYTDPTVTTPAPGAVAAVEELQMAGRRAYAFEGVTDATTDPVLMPSFLCKSGHGSQTTSYLIQNTSDQPTSVKITGYFIKSGKPVSPSATIQTVKAHGKVAFSACALAGGLATGWATVQSVGNTALKYDPQPIAVMGKVASSDGMATAFTGRREGSNQIYLPYVLWTATPTKGYSSTIGIMNAGGAATLKVTFYRNDNKTIVYTVPIAQNGYVSFDPKNTGGLQPKATKALRPDGSFRGAMEITVDSVGDSGNLPNLISVVRMERKVTGVSGYTYFGEDYTGIPAIP